MPEQIRPDGGHFELSPMYHSIVLQDLLDLVNLAHAFLGTVPERTVETWRAAAKRMRLWLAAMVHPDGDIAFFNDAALGIALRRCELDNYAVRLGLGPAPSLSPGVTHLDSSGYVRVEAEDMVAILDVARVGPDYQPGHAHADTLSFECSLFGRRLVVNVGTSTYEPGAQRAYERSTAAHSTVEVAGENSSEVWAAFRVARRARPFGLEIEERAGEVVVACAHDGYRRLRGRPVHRRTWRFSPGQLTIDDLVEPGVLGGVSRLHLHPDWAVGAGAGAAVDLAAGVGACALRRMNCPFNRGSGHPNSGAATRRRGSRFPCRAAGPRLESSTGRYEDTVPDRQLPAGGQCAGVAHLRALP